MVEPAVEPPVQVTPALLLRSAGARTPHAPEESTTRKGFSRTIGVWAILVYGGLGQEPAGALTTPTKTMFQFDPVQPPHWVLREIHCCWVAELTAPSTTVSDIQP